MAKRKADGCISLQGIYYAETMCQQFELSLQMPKNKMVKLRKSLVTTSLADFVQLMIKECRLSFIQTSQLKRLLSNDWNHEQEDHKGVV